MRAIEKRTILYLFYLFSAISLLVVPVFAHAAGTELLLSPGSGAFTVGQEFSVKVMVDPKGTKVNVAETVIDFDKQLLSVTKISKSGSVFSLWTTEPEFSNTKGTIVISGGTPSVFSNKSTVITVTFKGLKAGSANVSFSSGSVLAADGKGTDVFSQGISATYEIKEGVSQTEPEESIAPVSPAVEPRGRTPEAPEIISSTHKDSNKWYSTSTAKFSWDVSFDISSVRLLISSEEKNVTPSVVYTSPIKSRTIKNLEDGEWYFYAQFRNVSGWGKIGKKKILIDTVPPSEFDIELLDQGVHSASPKLLFETEDELSGIDYYEVNIGNDISATVYAENLVNGAYKIPPQTGGQKLVTIKAYDKAGNVQEIKKQLPIPSVEELITAEENENAPETSSSFTLERTLTLFFVFTTGALAAINVYSKRQFKKERANMLREVAEIREKSDKIFSAIREELEDQIDILDKKPQLTPAERELLEKMNEVLDISEELIDTEIEDLRKIARNS